MVGQRVVSNTLFNSNDKHINSDAVIGIGVSLVWLHVQVWMQELQLL